MADMNAETDIRDHERRVGELDGGFGFVTQQPRGVHRDLLGFQEETRTRFDRLQTDVAMLKIDLKQLRVDLPDTVGEVMREVLRETKR